MRGRFRIWQRAVGMGASSVPGCQPWGPGTEDGMGAKEKKGEVPREGGREKRKNFTKSFSLSLWARYAKVFLQKFRGNRTPDFRLTPHTAGQIDYLSTKSQPVLPGLDPSTIAPEGFEWYR